ncbi:MAG: tetratricopeptide repeat protein [Flavobacteriales bacterium]|jgi:Flp pilus assembly protein TadD|nr:tetratricopeptide repeat protein [Flavobacteriales bacterium]
MKKTRHTLLLAALATVVAGTARAQSLDQAVALTRNEQFAKAGAMFRVLLANDPRNGAIWYHYGEHFLDSDRADSAAIAYRKGVELHTLHPLPHVGQGKLAQGRGDAAAAQAHFQKALEAADNKLNKFDKKTKALVHREIAAGYAFGDTPDLAKALEQVDRAIALDPADAEAHIVKGDILLARNPSDATAPLAEYRRAMDLSTLPVRGTARRALMYHKGANYEAAITEYTKAIALDPAYAPAYRGRAESYFRVRKYAEATADYDTYLELNRGDQSARVRYAQFLYLVQDYPASLKLIEELQAEGVENNTLARLKGYSLVELKDTANALPALEAYLAAQPADALISSDLQYYGRAVALLGNDSLAGEKLFAAAAMPTADPDLYMGAGSYFTKARMLDRAVEAYQAKVHSAKVAVNDWYYLGSVAQRAKQFAVAENAWAQYVEKQPNIHQGYMGRARAHVGLDSTRTAWTAVPWYEEVVRKMKPEDIAKSPADAEEAYFYLGFYHFTVTKGLPAAKCWFERVKAVNAGTANTKNANDMLLTKELKDVRASACEPMPQGMGEAGQ